MWFEYFIDAFVGQFTIFMILISLSGLAGVIQMIRINRVEHTRKDRNFILGAALFSIFVGLLVFPIESFQVLQLMKTVDKYGFSISPGGFYITLVPMFYGLLWFLILLSGWLYNRRKAKIS